MRRFSLRLLLTKTQSTSAVTAHSPETHANKYFLPGNEIIVIDSGDT
jgi:hypothetical protein